jgi:hypothetical protein
MVNLFLLKLTVLYQSSIDDMDHEMDHEMEFEPPNNLYYEATRTMPCEFTVYLIMDHKEIGNRIFHSEDDAIRCLETMFPILGKEYSVALQEFDAFT